MSAALCFGLVLAPTVAAVLGLPTRGYRAASIAIALTGGLISLGCAIGLVVLTWDGRASATIALLGSADLGSRTISLDFSIGPLTSLVALAVTLVTFCVQLYSAGYLVPHAGDTGPLRYCPYAATISLFSAAMLVTIGADDLLLLLVGWEVMGFCSYLLIGHHSERPAARRAALQAFLVTKLADVGFVVGIVALYALAGTTNIPAVIERVAQLTQDPPDARTGALLSLAAIGLLIGVAGKSAQFPLHGWLPDAMEGPTPVSALIHAATMVAAGVVVLVRLGPVLDASDTARAVLAVVTIVSMLGAGIAALCADDLKRVLAWSTVSQIAVMLSAVSLGTPAGRAGAMALMLAHAAFKALLFLSAGMIATRFGTTKLSELSDLRRRDPHATALLAIGLAGLAGIPPLAGFVGKEGVFAAAEHLAGHPDPPAWLAVAVFAALTLTSLLTALYSGRLYGAVSRLDLDRRTTPQRPSRLVVSAATTSAQPVTHPTTPLPGAPTRPTAEPDAGAKGHQPAAGQIWPAQRGPSFQPAKARRPSASDPEETDAETLSFVDGRGEFQDWDLIAGLDSTRPSRWSPEWREHRKREAEEARRRLEAGHQDRQTRRLARRGTEPETADDPTAVGDTEDELPNRLARAVAGKRLSPTPDEVAPASSPAARAVAEHRVPADRRAQRPGLPKAEPAPGPKASPAMTVPVWVLAAATVTGGVLPLVAHGLRDYELGWLTAVFASLLAVTGVLLGLLRGPKGHRDVATRLPSGFRAAAAGGFGYQRAQQVLVIRPALALARLVTAGDDAVIGTWVRGPGWLPWLGRHAGRVADGRISGYLGWIGAAAVVLGAVALFASGVSA